MVMALEPLTRVYISLDVPADLHGLPRLPLLEEMPDELEVDWGEEPAET
jgi:hypothetical protein